ncbi:hypothetical protein BN7_6108 [Wickerhamomyces ciferrii]|uniref:Uncharacterized protein n=1 Tax=Wickerhamomyces ciferrii (strain ATCC 14091 / BCRC 22168 / CBS 111 / JCM 3599 / NBRC 0793 / NRRL Y-1031 F-60-10) TaxID=1206466 RepID=K0KMK8_WICCF|nr:uncharacterized protein BN7_6108 [Wickerhamomyces ciferrii]CCH46515.1 hypothetical protein BN7_6108 [Wickerhamomyces ciferrii]
MEHNNKKLGLLDWSLSWFYGPGAQTSKHETNNQQQQIQSSSETRDHGANRRQVLVVQENQEDPEFLDVTPQSLSYAEAASMAIQDDHKDANNNNNKTDGNDHIVDSNDLEAEVLDYQMSEFMKRKIKYQNYVASNYDYNRDLSSSTKFNDESLDIEEVLYNDKHHRRSKKTKFLKKGKN